MWDTAEAVVLAWASDGLTHCSIPTARPVFAEGEVTQKAAFWDWVNLFFGPISGAPLGAILGALLVAKFLTMWCVFWFPFWGPFWFPFWGAAKKKYIVRAPILGPFFGSHFGDTLFLFF